MKISKQLLGLITPIALMISCSGGEDGGTTDNDPVTDNDPIAVPDHKAASLVFPEDNTTCLEGESVNANFSSITFDWSDAQDTDTYTLHVTNIETNAVVFNLAVNDGSERTLQVEKGKPFSWYIISRASGTTATAQSATFKFYNAGDGIENYAPFPAEAVQPARGATLSGVTSVNFEWEASDVDDDIVSFEVFMSTATETVGDNPIGITEANTLEGIEVSAGNTYYWMVDTTDSQGNLSQSEVFEFRVN